MPQLSRMDKGYTFPLQCAYCRNSAVFSLLKGHLPLCDRCGDKGYTHRAANIRWVGESDTYGKVLHSGTRPQQRTRKHR
jgi:hypothetical protein